MLKKLKEEGILTESYEHPRFLKGILGSMKVGTKDKTIEMVYSSVFPKFLRKIAAKNFLSKGAVPAFGIVSGKEGETSGRDLLGEDKLPDYLTPEELLRDIENVLSQKVDIGKRKLDLRDIYLYALTNANTALVTDTIIEWLQNKQENR